MTLQFQRLHEDHCDVFHQLCTDEHVRRYLLDGNVVERDWALAEIATSSALFDTHGVGLWLVRDDAGALLGFCGFRVFETMGPNPQLLYAFPKRNTGRGHATRACAWMLERAHENGWTRVDAAVDEPNVKSIRVLERNGFVPCGRVPGDFGDTRLFEHVASPLERLPVSSGSQLRLSIKSTWNGAPLSVDEHVHLALTVREQELLISVDAPFFGDPAPSEPPGSTAQLWEHEVVELMLLGESDHYLEIELSPHGHYLVLRLLGRRHIVHQGYAIFYDARIDENRWSGKARIPMAWIPQGCTRLNAFAMHGQDAARAYWAWQPQTPAPESRPDFHALHTFGPLDACERVMLQTT